MREERGLDKVPVGKEKRKEKSEEEGQRACGNKDGKQEEVEKKKTKTDILKPLKSNLLISKHFLSDFGNRYGITVLNSCLRPVAGEELWHLDCFYDVSKSRKSLFF